MRLQYTKTALQALQRIPASIRKAFYKQAAFLLQDLHHPSNGMENTWYLLKRSLKGTYVSVAPFHLFRYLDEGAFRDWKIS